MKLIWRCEVRGACDEVEKVDNCAQWKWVK